MRRWVPALLGSVLAGCSGGAAPVIVSAPGPSIATQPTVPTAGEAPDRPLLPQDGALRLVIGKRADGLVRLFGPARIDLAEGDARKLQFASDVCVLDIFLYPPRADEPAVATHVEARKPQGSDTMDRRACIAALRR